MARNGLGLNGGSFVTQSSAAAIAAAMIDGFVEVTQLPLFNDESNIFRGKSNTEVILYSVGIIGSVLGAASALGKSKLYGNVGKELLAPSLGTVAGTYVYENFIAPAVIRTPIASV